MRVAGQARQDESTVTRGERRGAWALLGGCALSGLLGVAAVRVPTDYGFGDSAGLAASAADLGLPQSAEHPLWVLAAHCLHTVAPDRGAAWAANAWTAATSAGALVAIAFACLEAIRTTRAPMPHCGYRPQRADYWVAWLCATGFMASPAIRETLTQASTWPLSLALGAAFLWLTQRWRRRGSASPADAFALALVGGLCLTHDAWLIVFVLAGVFAVLFYRASMVLRDWSGAPTGRHEQRTALWTLAGVVLGLSPALLAGCFILSGGADVMGARAFCEYLLGDLAGPHLHDVGVLGAPLAARDALMRIAATVGAPLGLMCVAGAVWASVDRAAIGATTFGRSASAGLWPGVLCFAVGWTLGWGYTGWNRTLALLPCSLGCTLMAAAGSAMLLEAASTAQRFRLVRSWLCPCVLALLSAGLGMHLMARPGDSGSLAPVLARATLDALPENAIVVVGNDLYAPEHLVYPLSYEQRVHGARPDVTLIGVSGPFTEAEWTRIARHFRLRRVLGDDACERWRRIAGATLRPLATTEWLDGSARDHGAAGPLLMVGLSASDTHPSPVVLTVRAETLGPLGKDMLTSPMRAAALGEGGREGMARARAAVATAPESATNWVVMSRLLLENGEIDEALIAADEARRLDPLRAQAWLIRAAALESLGRTEEARRSVEVGRSVSRRDAAFARLCAEWLEPRG